jgi:hypothetical protein
MPSTLLTAQLLFLEAENPTLPIKLYINSPGGSVTAGLAIYDTMQYIQSPVHTFCMGQAASMGSLLLAGGEKGHRYVLKNGSVMIHRTCPSSSSLSKRDGLTGRTIRRSIRSSIRYSITCQGDSKNTSLINGYLRFTLSETRRRVRHGQREVLDRVGEGLFHDCSRGY